MQKALRTRHFNDAQHTHRLPESGTAGLAGRRLPMLPARLPNHAGAVIARL
ncbi:hypothetical protein [Burkholderia cenocepacia]|uniref:hypothetical protein n=1 Tax=Burkholderia cenocepacia TaxID=95486 RepID=UPI0013E03F4F|nr:hypothetical protein [Burkholderia cenocepacia]MBR8507780.1 hypothetical protein [Burkholderia cenocepacia]